MPLGVDEPVVTLNEGQTPLMLLDRLPKALGLDVNWWVKFEGANPSGSFKDRGMTLAVTKCVNEGSKAIVCASTGNTSASAAAYAARAGIKAFVVIPAGKIARGKLAQAVVHGAYALEIEGNFDEGLSLVRRLVDELPMSLVNSVNPYRLVGQRTLVFEVCDALGKAPDYHFLPVGNAGNISAHWAGYQQYRELNRIDSLPIMVGFQAAGANPLVLGTPVEDPETVATAIRIGRPTSWHLAQAAVSESGGFFGQVTDDEILQAQSLLARHEGYFCEPASAASIAGVIKAYREGQLKSGVQIVSTLTGHGLKDPDIIKVDEQSMVSLPANFETLKDYMTERLT